MKILIIEDEPSSALRLRRMLEDAHEVVGTCVSNAEVRAFFANEAHAEVQLILADIQLGDGLSFESLRTVPVDVPVIFTTAYDQYAVQSFKYNGIDYLLKPIDKEDLQAALAEVERKIRAVHMALVSHSTTEAITQLLDSVKTNSIRYHERFLIPHHGDEFVIVPVSDVSHITIRDGVVRLCTLQGKSYILSTSLEEVEKELDPQRFMRVNRQFIVSVAAVAKLSTHFLGKVRIHVTSFPDTEIIVGKEKVAAVKRWLDS